MRYESIYDKLPADQLIAMRQNDATLAEIGAHFHVSTVTARKALIFAGWQDPEIYRHGRTPESIREQACALYASGLTCKQAGERVGRSGTCVGEWVRAKGLMRHRFYGGTGSNFGLTEEVLLDHLDAGDTYQQIADAHGCSYMTVLGACHYHGIHLGKGYWEHRVHAEHTAASRQAIRAAVDRVREHMQPSPPTVPEWPDAPAWLADILQR